MSGYLCPIINTWSLSKITSLKAFARTDFDGVTVVLTDPCDGLCLPAGIAFGGVNDQHVHTGLQQGGNTLCVVAGIDTGTDQITLLSVQQFLRILLVRGVVLVNTKYIR